MFRSSWIYNCDTIINGKHSNENNRPNRSKFITNAHKSRPYHVAGWWRASQCFKLVYNFDDDYDSNVFAKMKILQTDLIGAAIDKRILFPKAYQVT